VQKNESKKKPLVLAVEDEDDIADLLKFILENEGFAVELCSRGDEVLAACEMLMPDLILLDLMLPGIPGIPLCRQIRNNPATAKIPVIMLTAKSQETDIVAGLEAGAADYVTKPFSPRILVARIRAVLGNRSTGIVQISSGLSLVFGDLTINPERFEVRIGATPLLLTASEFGILFTLASKPGCVFSREHIIEQVKGTGYSVSERTIDVQIASLRKKMASAADRIETVRGVGYKFQDV